MPAYYRIHLDGGWLANPETWSTSLAVTSDGTDPSAAQLSTWCNDVMALIAGSAPGATVFKGLMSTACELRQVRAYWYPDVGAPAGQQGASTATPVAGVGTVEMPPQVALVLTLLTGQPGGSYRGRMYLPAAGAPASSSGTTSRGSQGNVDNLGDLLVSIADAAPEIAATLPAVVSERLSTVTAVTQVRLGNRLDTQRRRSDSIVETYYTTSIP